MKKTILAAVALATLAAAPAYAQQRSCLEFGRIYNWTVLDNKTLVVEDLSHNKFRMALMGDCQGLSFKERIGFKSMGATALSCMTPGDDVIIRNFGTGGQRCPIAKIVPYTAELQKSDADAAAAKKAAQDQH
ncbi:MAG TPA: DUF6491 family protein [Rhizomicrobium sp.]|jgi:hypothetical protein